MTTIEGELAERKEKTITPWLKKGETVILFGDSLTDAKNGYASMLQQILLKRGITVINAGRGGDKTPWALTRLEQDVISRKPDALLIAFGGNDSVIGRGEWHNEPRISPVTFKENIRWIIHLSQHCVQKFSIMTQHFRIEGPKYHEFGDIRGEYILGAREVADDTGSRLIPLDTVFRRLWEQHLSEVSPEGFLYTRDGYHPTPQGHRIIADTVLEYWGLK